MLKKQRILAKIILMVAPLAILSIVLGVYAGASQLRTLSEAKAVYYDELKVLIDKITQTDRDFYQSQMGIEHAVAAAQKGDDAGVSKGLDDYSSNREQVIDGVDEIENICSGDAYLYKTYRASGQAEAISSIIARTKSAVTNWDNTYNPNTGAGDYDGLYSAFLTARGDLNEITDIVEEYSDYLNEKMQSEIRQKIIVLVIVLVIVIAAVGFLVVSILRYILGATKEVSESVRHLANGEFRKIDKYTDYKDELGGMVCDTNAVIEKLQEIIGSIKEMSEMLGVSSDDLAGTADQISQTADDVSNAIQDIAKGATEQADNIQQASESVGNIDAAVSSVTDNSVMLADTANTMNTSSQESVGELDKLMKSSELMNRNVEEIAGTIAATSQAVNAINDKVDMITTIASQTNLLALNASIEAARAGEAGRGFAVVATEIGNLASDSNAMADEIRKEMATLLAQSEQANRKADEVKKVVQEQQNVLKTTVDSIHALIGDIETTVGGVGSISSNADTCIQAKDVVVDVMSSLSAISEENAASTEQTAASMQELNATVNVLADSATKLNQLAQRLSDDIAFFK